MINIHPESGIPEPEKNFESEIKNKARLEIQKARNNPISEARLKDLRERMTHYEENFFKEGFQDSAILDDENQMISEILKSSAVADTIILYKEILKEMAEKYDLPKDWAERQMIRHNANANVSEANGHSFVGYYVIFVKNDDGSSSFIPMYTATTNPDWSPEETVLKTIEAINGPNDYGEGLSVSDKTKISKYEKTLNDIRESNI